MEVEQLQLQGQIEYVSLPSNNDSQVVQLAENRVNETNQASPTIDIHKTAALSQSGDALIRTAMAKFSTYLITILKSLNAKEEIITETIKAAHAVIGVQIPMRKASL